MGAWHGFHPAAVTVQRMVIVLVVGALLVLAAYFWGGRLNASTEASLSRAPQYDTLRGVAGVRAANAVAVTNAASVASYHSFTGVAAVRAANAEAMDAQLAGLNGVAAVREVDASR
jgi:hypothetical protein